LEVVFHCKVWFRHTSFSLKFWKDLTSACCKMSLLIFDAIFHWRLSLLKIFVKFGLGKKIALNGDLTIDEVREHIRAKDEMVQG
jgi:hypothetical protein